MHAVRLLGSGLPQAALTKVVYDGVLSFTLRLEMGVVLSFAWLGHAFGGFQGAFAYDLTAGYGAGFAAGAIAGAINLTLVGIIIWLTRPKVSAPRFAI